MITLSDRISNDLATTRYVCYTPRGWSPFIDQAADFPIREDLETLRSRFDGLITYGLRGRLKEIAPIANELGFRRLILGVYDITDEAELSAAEEIIESYPDLVRALCLGNEGLAFHFYETEELVAVIRRFRARFPNLWITTSEPIFSWGLEDLTANVDFGLPIIHPWIHDIFQSDPEMAAMWTIQAAQRLQILIGKPVLIKETGFPANGTTYAYDLQTRFWETLTRELGALTREVYLAYFEAFDNPLKTTFSAQKDWDCHWGLFHEDRSAKPMLDLIDELPAERRRPPSLAVSGVSVVIAGRNRPGYMRLAIESVWQQLEDVERLILVNDNSTDLGVDELCREYADHPKVIYVHRTSPGSSGTARNAGLEHVQTEFVCFLDDDDLFADGKLRAQRALFAEDPSLDFIATAAHVITSDGDICGRSGSPEFFAKAPVASMLAFCRIIHSSVMMKTALVRAHGGYKERFQGEDWELWCRFLREGARMGYISEPLTYYRRHAANISDRTYLHAAVDNVFSNHLIGVSSEELLGGLGYDRSSGELLRAAISLMHGRYELALNDLTNAAQPAGKVARFICYRELGRHDEAHAELRDWANESGLGEELELRLEIHKKKYQPRQVSIGSPALLFEHRLLAQDALRASLDGTAAVDLRRYFFQNPKNISIERNAGSDDDLFFKRVSLTSC